MFYFDSGIMDNGSPQRSGVLGSARVWPVKQMRERELPRSKAEIQGWFAGIALAPAESTLPPDGRGDPFNGK